MIDRKLFGINKLVEDFVQTLRQVEIIDALQTRYIDKDTGKEWLKYCICSDPFAIFNLLQIEPTVNTVELIEIALNSTYPDEAYAAASRLNLEERLYHREYRIELLSRLQEAVNKQLKDSDKARIETIIESAQLLSTTNQREIVGKHYTEIEKDAAFYKDIANKSRLILNKLWGTNHKL